MDHLREGVAASEPRPSQEPRAFGIQRMREYISQQLLGVSVDIFKG